MTSVSHMLCVESVLGFLYCHHVAEAIIEDSLLECGRIEAGMLSVKQTKHSW